MMERQQVIPRLLSDGNFIHTVSLFPALRMYAKSVHGGHIMGHDDVNMVHLPVELLEAFMRDYAMRRGPVAKACREALAKSDELLALMASAEGDGLVPTGSPSDEAR